MKIPYLTIISVAALAIVISVYAFLLIQNEPIRPQSCQGSQSNNCIYNFGMWMDNRSNNYDAYPVTDKVNKPVEFDGMRFVYTGSSTPDKDGTNCDNIFPREINSTTGHHPPIIVNYGGYFKINETRHFTATFANGQTKFLTLCWNDHVMPKVIEMSDSGLGSPMFCPSKTSWFDDNKTAGIIQGEYCSPDSPDYDKYIAEKK
ncbi:MAG: hypothetical protein ACRDFB_01315 [Rhabdochlamydiaceae bacterium]